MWSIRNVTFLHSSQAISTHWGGGKASLCHCEGDPSLGQQEALGHLLSLEKSPPSSEPLAHGLGARKGGLLRVSAEPFLPEGSSCKWGADSFCSPSCLPPGQLPHTPQSLPPLAPSVSTIKLNFVVVDIMVSRNKPLREKQIWHDLTYIKLSF